MEYTHNSFVGHGLSEGVPGYVERFSHYTDDVLQYANIIKEKIDNKPLFLVGYIYLFITTHFTTQLMFLLRMRLHVIPMTYTLFSPPSMLPFKGI